MMSFFENFVLVLGVFRVVDLYNGVGHGPAEAAEVTELNIMIVDTRIDGLNTQKDSVKLGFHCWVVYWR